MEWDYFEPKEFKGAVKDLLGFIELRPEVMYVEDPKKAIIKFWCAGRKYKVCFENPRIYFKNAAKILVDYLFEEHKGLLEKIKNDAKKQIKFPAELEGTIWDV